MERSEDLGEQPTSDDVEEVTGTDVLHATSNNVDNESGEVTQASEGGLLSENGSTITKSGSRTEENTTETETLTETDKEAVEQGVCIYRINPIPAGFFSNPLGMVPIPIQLGKIASTNWEFYLMSTMS